MTMKGEESPGHRGDEDVGVRQVLVQLGVVALLVGGHYQRVAPLLQPVAQPQCVLRRAQQPARRDDTCCVKPCVS